MAAAVTTASNAAAALLWVPPSLAPSVHPNTGSRGHPATTDAAPRIGRLGAARRTRADSSSSIGSLDGSVGDAWESTDLSSVGSWGSTEGPGSSRGGSAAGSRHQPGASYFGTGRVPGVSQGRFDGVLDAAGGGGGPLQLTPLRGAGVGFGQGLGVGSGVGAGAGAGVGVGVGRGGLGFGPGPDLPAVFLPAAHVPAGVGVVGQVLGTGLHGPGRRRRGAPLSAAVGVSGGGSAPPGGGDAVDEGVGAGHRTGGDKRAAAPGIGRGYFSDSAYLGAGRRVV